MDSETLCPARTSADVPGASANRAPVIRNTLAARVLAWQDAPPAKREARFRELLAAAQPLLRSVVALFEGPDIDPDEARHVASIALWAEAARWDRAMVPPGREAFIPASVRKWLRRGIGNALRKHLRHSRLVRAVPSYRVDSLDMVDRETD